VQSTGRGPVPDCLLGMRGLSPLTDTRCRRIREREIQCSTALSKTPRPWHPLPDAVSVSKHRLIRGIPNHAHPALFLGRSARPAGKTATTPYFRARHQIRAQRVPFDVTADCQEVIARLNRKRFETPLIQVARSRVATYSIRQNDFVTIICAHPLTVFQCRR